MGVLSAKGMTLSLPVLLDSTKDQSYVLWGLTREQLQSTLLPLGDFRKDEIRAIASQNNLASGR